MTDWENMETIDVLERVGLKGKEASVYLALLELGTASVESIAKKAGTKRPTTYLVLDDLQNRGLVSIVPQQKKSCIQQSHHSKSSLTSYAARNC